MYGNQGKNMKKIIIALVTVLMLAGSFEAKSQINAGINFNTFYTELSPYGRWVNYPEYGQVWISNESGFEPYSTNGHWEFTNYGWMWISDYSWGWAPFHYGRWAYLTNYGWAWVPGYDWAPAWVGWCNYGGYYGWAPLSPGLGFNYTFSSIPYSYWRFVNHQYITDRNIYRHFRRPAINANQYNNVTVINNTVVNNNTTYNAGPSQQQVESITRKKLEPKEVAFSEQANKKTEVINKKQVRVYRPAAEKKVAAERNEQPVKPAPVIQKQEAIAQQPQKIAQEQAGIKQQQTPVKNKNQGATEENIIQKQNTSSQDAELIRQKKEAMQKQQQKAAQEAAIKQQQQNEARQQEILRQKQNQARQQEMIRQQQQNEIRQQRQEQIKAQRQNEIRQQRQEQVQSQWNTPSVQKEQPQPVRQKRKGLN